MNEKNKEAISLSISDFQVVSYLFNEQKSKPENFGFNLDINAESTDKSFKIKIAIEVKKSKKAKSLIAKIETITSFEKEYIEGEIVDKKVNANLINTLIDIAYSTTRGALIVKSQDNFLSEFPLPLLDIDAIEKSIQKKNKSTKK